MWISPHISYNLGYHLSDVNCHANLDLICDRWNFQQFKRKMGAFQNRRKTEYRRQKSESQSWPIADRLYVWPCPTKLAIWAFGFCHGFCSIWGRPVPSGSWILCNLQETASPGAPTTTPLLQHTVNLFLINCCLEHIIILKALPGLVISVCVMKRG